MSLTAQAIYLIYYLLFRLGYFEKLKSSQGQINPLPVREFYITQVLLVTCMKGH